MDLNSTGRGPDVGALEMFSLVWLMVLCLLTIWLFKEKRVSFIHESGLALFFGIFLGLLVKYGPINAVENISKRTEDTELSTQILFYILLPPIIFNAGYSVDQNFGAILSYAFIGTFISCFAFGGVLYGIIYYTNLTGSYFTLADCLLFGALISATDPVTTLAIFSTQNVDKDVYSFVFGESILNDVASIVLTQQIEMYAINSEFEPTNLLKGLGHFFLILFGSCLTGSCSGFVNAIITKFVDLKNQPAIETTIFFLISYSSFLLAEAFQLTGIVAVLICGLVQAHYTFKNLSAESQQQTVQMLDLLNFLNDNLIFIFIGYSVFTLKSQQWEILFISASFVAIFVARALNIYPLSFLINLTRSKESKVPFYVQHLLFFSGLRGALSFSLSMKDTSTQARQLIVTTTSIIVIVTVFFNGGLTTNTIKLLRIKCKDDPNKEKMDSTETNNWKRWKRCDNNFMLPLLTNYKVTLIETMPKFLQPLSKLLTTKEQLNANNHVEECEQSEKMISLNEIKTEDTRENNV